MPLNVPALDDRDYAQLLAEAKQLVPALAPDWTDLGPGDPGVVLLELFSYLTESLLFRLNRLPDKAYVTLLNLVGVRLTPPAVARTDLVFTRTGGTDAAVTVKAGTRVATSRPTGPVFVTVRDVVVPAGAPSASVTAMHCDLRDEQLGEGTGQAGQRFVVAQPPIVLDSGEVGDLYVGVEATAAELGGDGRTRVPSIRLDGRTYRLWREVPHFGGDVGDGCVYSVDRSTGEITFGPAATGAKPARGRAIHAWYRTGGGAAGNVRADTLVVPKTPLAGLSVTNPAAATGGRDAETLDEALRRCANPPGSLDRVVTARDYERVAVACTGGVSRALAVTAAELWNGAEPGRVRVLVVPTVDATDPLAVTADELTSRQAPHVLERVAQVIADRRPMGVASDVGWAGLKRFHVEADAVVVSAEDAAGVLARLRTALARELSPVPVDGRPGWPFGEALRASTVYDVLLGDAGVRFVENVRLVVEDVPGDVSSLAPDPSQPSTWYAASGPSIFRSGDDADGWELLSTFPGERVERVGCCPGAPGVVVSSSRVGDGEASRVRVSTDHGESWRVVAETDFHVEDVAVALDGTPVVFAASDRGLFRLSLAPGSVPESLIVDGSDAAMPCYAVAVVSGPGAPLQVAVAAQELRGVYVSFQSGRSGTYAAVGQKGVDVRLLRLQTSPGRRFLLAGAYATGTDAGAGVSRLELLPYQPSPDGWTPIGSTWVGGSCRDLATTGERVIAATARDGVCVADNPRAPWRAAAVDSGLPLREVGRFAPVAAIGCANGLVLAGCVGGVYRSGDARVWRHTSPAEFTERVTLPSTWLFAPGQHQLRVRSAEGYL